MAAPPGCWANRRSSSSAEVCHDEDVAHRVPHDTGRNRAQELALARPQPTVADDDEVRRVRADGVEKGLRRIPADQPLIDVAHPLLGETGDRFLQGPTGRAGPVKVAVLAFDGGRSRTGVVVAVRRDDDQASLGGLCHLGGQVHGVQAGRGAVRTDHDPVVHRDGAVAAERHDRRLVLLVGRVHPQHRHGADTQQDTGEGHRVGAAAVEKVGEDPAERHRLYQHRHDDHHVQDSHVDPVRRAGTMLATIM
ncbi:MAG TPA: hypothetical protein VLK57_00535 [Pseudonocardia sp.]|nr:hypothetical protein [Pseudonocardia sp.]